MWVNDQYNILKTFKVQNALQENNLIWVNDHSINIFQTIFLIVQIALHENNLIQ